MKVNSAGTRSKCRPNHSLRCATIAVVIAALIGAAGFGSAALAQQAQTAGIVDWHGTIKKTAKGGGHNHTIDINFEFVVEPDGSIKGRARARVRTEEAQVPACTMLWTYSPSEFDIPLSGRRNGEEFEITLEPGTTTATFAGCGQSNTFPAHLNPAVHAQTKYRIPARDGAKDTIDLQAGALPWGVVMRDTIEIRRDCRDSELSSGRYTQSPFGPETPADIAPSCNSCLGGTWELKIGHLNMRPSERADGWQIYGVVRKYAPQCIYSYEATWLCTTTNEVQVTEKPKVVDHQCVPRS